MPEASAVTPPTPIAQLYRQMWLHAHGARARLLGALALQLGSQGLKLALPWLAAQAINAIQLGGPLLALWWLSALTGSLALAGFVAIGAAVMGFDRRLMALAGAENHAERRYAARMLDYIGNISALASLRLQGATRALLGQRLAAVFEPLSRSIVLTEWKWCTVDLATVILGWVLVMVYAASGAGSAAGTTLLIGNLFMVHQHAQQAAGVLCSVAANYQGLARKQADFASADIVQQAPQAAAPAAADGGWQRITLHDLRYAHAAAGGEAPRGGIHGVTLELVRGERVALVGPSGSGKSTLLRVLAGLYEAGAGTVSIDGAIEPGRRHAAELATLIPQEAEVFEASVRENLTFGQPVDDAALARAVHASALDEVLAGLPQGLDHADERARLQPERRPAPAAALARGVLAARGRTLLLLDEPTSALDPLIERHVHERIERLFDGACIVAAVHRLSLLPHFDRVVFMAGGRVVDVGTADALRARQPVFAAMCRGAAQPA